MQITRAAGIKINAFINFLSYKFLMPSGKLLVVYGVNHVHKTNNARKLAELIKQRGKKADFIEYPNYSLAPSGFYIDQALRAKLKLREEELQIWFTLNRFQYQPVLEKKLSEGTHIIAKDYIGTAIAWAKIGRASCRE